MGELAQGGINQERQEELGMDLGLPPSLCSGMFERS